MKKLYDGVQRFCAAHPRFGIPNLMRVIVIGNAAVYILSMLTMYTNPAALDFLKFNLNGLLHGEIWRIVTFIFYPSASSPLMLIISLYFYYWIGSTLEQQWGTAKFNLYYFSGMLLTVIGAILASLITGNSFISVAGTTYVNLSMFFAFATLYPDAQVLLFFFIPVKIKWMAILDACYFAYIIFFCAASRYWIGVVLPLVALLNFFVFFAPEIGRFAKREQTRTKQAAHFHNAVRQTQREQQSQGYRHKCAVCGRTDVTNPELQFRYCSKCAGYHCFCSDHIFNHVHFTDENP